MAVRVLLKRARGIRGCKDQPIRCDVVGPKVKPLPDFAVSQQFDMRRRGLRRHRHDIDRHIFHTIQPVLFRPAVDLAVAHFQAEIRVKCDGALGIGDGNGRMIVTEKQPVSRPVRVIRKLQKFQRMPFRIAKLPGGYATRCAWQTLRTMR